MGHQGELAYRPGDLILVQESVDPKEAKAG